MPGKCAVSPECPFDQGVGLRWQEGLVGSRSQWCREPRKASKAPPPSAVGLVCEVSRALACRYRHCRQTQPATRYLWLATKQNLAWRQEIPLQQIGRASCRERVCQYV